MEETSKEELLTDEIKFEYNCFVCSTGFVSETELNNHLEDHEIVIK